MVCTILYVANGLAVYLLVGNAPWLESPVTVSMQDGLAKDVCQVFVVLYFSLALMVDGTIFVQNVQKFLQPKVSSILCKCLQRSEDQEHSQGLRQLQVCDYGTSASDSEPKDSAASAYGEVSCSKSPGAGRTGSSHNEYAISSSTQSPLRSFLWWLLWCLLVIGVAIVITMFLSDFDDVLGLTAALIASQAVVSWPAFFHYWLFRRSRPKSKTCYYHSNGTDPCHCDEPSMVPLVEGLVIVSGVCLLLFGVWSNFVDAADQLDKDKHGIMACANPLRAAKSLASDIFSN